MLESVIHFGLIVHWQRVNYQRQELVLEVKPSLCYRTIGATGIIDVMDKVQLNFAVAHNRNNSKSKSLVSKQ